MLYCIAKSSPAAISRTTPDFDRRQIGALSRRFPYPGSTSQAGDWRFHEAATCHSMAWMPEKSTRHMHPHLEKVEDGMRPFKQVEVQ